MARNHTLLLAHQMSEKLTVCIWVTIENDVSGCRIWRVVCGLVFA